MRLCPCCHCPCFDPRSRGGSDNPAPGSTRPVGGFDPRSRGGSDAGAQASAVRNAMFRSTLPWGERPKLTKPLMALMMFRSTLPWGERRSQNNSLKNQWKVPLFREPLGAATNWGTMVPAYLAILLKSLGCEPHLSRAVACGSRHTIKRSSGSSEGLDPTCSTRLRHSLPRK